MIPYVDFPAQYRAERDQILAVVDDVFSQGHFVGGEAINKLEIELAELCGVKHAIAVNSGTDALLLALKAAGVGQGDEVITVPNSFVATAAVIVQVGARPVFVDVLPDQNIDPEQIEPAITSRTKAILPVHLTGRICDMAAVQEIADRNDLVVIEDAAQAIGARYLDRHAGSMGAFGCFSTHPLKNLNAAGDGGFVVTNDDTGAERIKSLRNHGIEGRDTIAEWGQVSRMDVLQAAVLRMRLKNLSTVTDKRRGNAALYRQHLNSSRVFSPPCRNEEFNVFHTFVVQLEKRSELQEHLASKGIGSAIHYPIPLHLQPAASELGYQAGDFPVTESQSQRILSLPVHQFLTDADIITVANEINAFYS